MFRRRNRNIFSRKKRSFPKWLVGMAAVAIGIAIAAPSVADSDCIEKAAPCLAIAIDQSSVETAPVGVGAERVAAKRTSDTGRRKVAEMTLIGLLLGNGQGINIGLR